MSATRSRAPLASIPNATNSPHRSVTQSIGKRSRPQGTVLQEDEWPPKKKQVVDITTRPTAPSTPRRPIPPSIAEGHVFERGPTQGAPTDFQRRLIASRKDTERLTHDLTGSGARSWHKYYRKVFHTFVFYFDNVSDEIQVKFSKQLRSFGAREEKFFSRAVTHIVTTRPIPSKSSPPNKSSQRSNVPFERNAEEPPGTINPSLLHKKSTAAGHAFISKYPPSAAVRRDGAVATDVLLRGRQMSMTIWALEKFHRILTSMLEYDAACGQNLRANMIGAETSRTRDEDLSQALRNEKTNGSLDRDLAASMKEMVLFKGPFIYVHDVEGKTRPIMVRQYPKVDRSGDGAWPQFRSTAVGKCPFIEDPLVKKEQERERAAERTQQVHQTVQTRSVDAYRDATRNNVRRSPRKALKEVQNAPAPAPAVRDVVPKAQIFEAPRVITQPCFARRQDSAGCFIKPDGAYTGREPVASGIQQSNLTSAIRSQMISSTAAGPGAKAGTSREVNELKRKVLERTHTGSLSVGSIPSSHRMTDIAGTLKNVRAPPPQRAAKNKARERLGGVGEEAENSEDELAGPMAVPPAPLKKKKVAAKKDSRPGYCENCRDKYDDFDDHIASRKHRKFAMTESNWTELDRLLRKLQQHALQQERQQHREGHS